MRPSSGPAPQDQATKNQSHWSLSSLALWIGVGAAVLGAAMVLRYFVIEPQSIGMACADTVRLWWCGPRQALLMMHIFDIWGWCGLVGGAVGLVWGWRVAVWVGFVMSLAGLVLYNADLAAVGLILTCLRLPRVSQTSS